MNLYGGVDPSLKYERGCTTMDVVTLLIIGGGPTNTEKGDTSLLSPPERRV